MFKKASFWIACAVALFVGTLIGVIGDIEVFKPTPVERIAATHLAEEGGWKVITTIPSVTLEYNLVVIRTITESEMDGGMTTHRIERCEVMSHILESPRSCEEIDRVEVKPPNPSKVEE